MNTEYLIEESITKAAALARGDKLMKLAAMCEKQKTISTNKIGAEIDEIAVYMKDCARLIRTLSEFVK